METIAFWLAVAVATVNLVFTAEYARGEWGSQKYKTIGGFRFAGIILVIVLAVVWGITTPSYTAFVLIRVVWGLMFFITLLNLITALNRYNDWAKVCAIGGLITLLLAALFSHLA